MQNDKLSNKTAPKRRHGQKKEGTGITFFRISFTCDTEKTEKKSTENVVHFERSN